MTRQQQGEVVYHGPRFDVRSVELAGQPGGAAVQRDAVITSDAVVVLPLLDEQTVVLIRNERFVVGRTLWELCAGTMDAGEAPIAAASRELVEETGYRAGRIEPLTDFYPSPGVITERMWAFVARDLAHVGQDLDDNERIEVEVLPWDRTIQMIRDGVIRDGKTIATLLHYQTFIRGAF